MADSLVTLNHFDLMPPGISFLVHVKLKTRKKPKHFSLFFFFILNEMSTFGKEVRNNNLFGIANQEVALVDKGVNSYQTSSVTTFGSRLDFQLSPKETTQSNEQTDNGSKKDNEKRGSYKRYRNAEKEKLMELVIGKGLSIRAAALQLDVRPSTAHSWVKKEKEAPEPSSPRRNERLSDDQSLLDMDPILETLTNQFDELKLSNTALYNLVTDKCRISLKRAPFHPVHKNSPENIEARVQWASTWCETAMDYMTNCVFVNETTFQINMKRSFAWSKVGTCDVVKLSKTRTKARTVFGAISPHGVVNVALPLTHELESSIKETENPLNDTAIGYYRNFLSRTMDIMDEFKQLNGQYLVMDDVPINTKQEIQNYIKSRGYSCVFLPPHSPELNPIEQFWSVCESKLKKEPLLDEESFNTKIGIACNQILLSDLTGFCSYSQSKFPDCLGRKPISK